MVAALLIALATWGPAGHDDRRADDHATATPPPAYLDLADPFGDRDGDEVVAHARIESRLDLKDPFDGRRHALRRAPAAEAPRQEPAMAPADLRDPFERRGTLRGDEPGCPTVRADNGATIQLPEGVTPPTCGRRGSPHLVNPFARPDAR